MQTVERPLSPHLSVYRFKYTFITSFANRMTGVGLSVGLVVLVYWLSALAAGSQAFDKASIVLGHPVFKVLLVLFGFAVVYHLIAGIRHLVWDTGHGLERAQSKSSAAVVIGVSIVLFLVLAAWCFIHWGAA
jgi:succinate dehydrogenase / fumarate reductase cytochrome b subunit